MLDKYGLPDSVELIEEGVRGCNATAAPMVQLELGINFQLTMATDEVQTNWIEQVESTLATSGMEVST